MISTRMCFVSSHVKFIARPSSTYFVKVHVNAPQSDPLFYCGVSLVVVETRDHVELKEALSNRRIAHPF